MRLIDADVLLEQIDTEREILVKDGRLGTEHILVHYVREFIEDASTIDAVKATMPWTDPDGTKRMLDEVSYEIGYSQGQKDTKRQGHWEKQYFDLVSGKTAYACTACGTHSIEASDYCPKCGARMDGGDAK